MRVLAMTVPAMALLASCGPSNEGTSNAATPTVVAKPGGFAEKVVALSEPQRRGVILRAIRDAGNACQGVIGTRRQPAGIDGLPAWAATCQDGSNWLISFGDDGMARVTGLPARK